MPRGCSICGHPQRPDIDEALRNGETFRNVAERFAGTHPTSLFRHKNQHLGQAPRTGQRAEPARAAPDGDPVEVLDAASTDRSATPNDDRTAPVPKRERNKTAGRKLERAERELNVWQLRKSGKAYPEIAAELGISTSTAFTDVERVLDRTRGDANETAAHARAIELARCDAIIASLWDRATDPGGAFADTATGLTRYSPAQDKAVAELHRMMERRAALLGLDAPSTAVSVTIVNHPAFQESLRAIFGALAPFPEARDAVMASLRGALAAHSKTKPQLVAG